MSLIFNRYQIGIAYIYTVGIHKDICFDQLITCTHLCTCTLKTILLTLKLHIMFLCLLLIVLLFYRFGKLLKTLAQIQVFFPILNLQSQQADASVPTESQTSTGLINQFLMCVFGFVCMYLLPAFSQSDWMQCCHCRLFFPTNIFPHWDQNGLQPTILFFK